MPVPSGKEDCANNRATIDLLVASSEAAIVMRLAVVVTGQPGVARFHESRAGSAGRRRPNPETRKVREQVCVRQAAQTPYARKPRSSLASS